MPGEFASTNLATVMTVRTIQEWLGDIDATCVMPAIVQNVNGSVLGTCLMLEHGLFPGAKS